MAAADTIYSARFAGPEIMERGRGNLLKCPVYRDGALAMPTDTLSSLVVSRPDGTVLATVAPIVVTASVANHNVASATLAAETLGEGWSLLWALRMPDGITHTFRRAAALCRRSLYPVVTDADLIRRHSDLSELRPSTLDSYQPYLDEAWVEVLHLLRQRGSLPQLVCSPEDLRYVHLYRTLELVFRDFTSTASGDKWADLAAYYASEGKEAWGKLSLKYDPDEDGIADSQRRPATPVTMLSSHGRVNSWQ